MHRAPRMVAPQAILTLDLQDQSGANQSVRNEVRGTPLHMAAPGNRARVIGVLSAAGADLGARSDAGEPALVAASQLGRCEAVKALRASGVRG